MTTNMRTTHSISTDRMHASLLRLLSLPAPRLDEETGLPANEHQLESWRAVLFRLAAETFPISGTLLLFFVTQAVTLGFVGHRLGTDLQAAFAIALSIFNVTGMSLCIGFLSGLDTLCSQAFGRDPSGRLLPPIVHRGVLVSLLLCVPIIVGFLLSEPLLIWAFGSNLGAPASAFVRMMPFYLVSNTFGFGVQRGLQAQQATQLSLASSIAGLVTCPIANYYATTEALGMPGVAVAMTLTNVVGTVTVTALAIWHPMSKIGTIPGSSSNGEEECAAVATTQQDDDGTTPRMATSAMERYLAAVFSWSSVKELFDVGLPSLASVCAEWWAFEFLMLTVARYGATITDTFSIAFSILILMIALPAGSSSAAGARLGNALGANEPLVAEAWQRITFTVNIGVASIDALVLVFFGDYVLSCYTDDAAVKATFRSGLGSVIFLHFFDCLQTACQNTFRGASEQATAARFSLLSLWLIGLPLSIVLTLLVNPDWRFAASVAGFTTGLVVTIVLCIRHSRTWNWTEKALKASTEARNEDDGDAADTADDYSTAMVKPPTSCSTAPTSTGGDAASSDLVALVAAASTTTTTYNSSSPAPSVSTRLHLLPSSTAAHREGEETDENDDDDDDDDCRLGETATLIVPS